MLKIPSYMFQKQRLIIQNESSSSDKANDAKLFIVDALVQSDIEWRLLSGGIEKVGFPTISPAATIGNVPGSGAGGYDILDYEAEKIQQRSQMAVCAREMMVRLHDRQHAALLLSSYPSRSPRGSGASRVGGRNSRAISLQGVCMLQGEIAKELGFFLPTEFSTSMALKKSSARAKASMCKMLKDVL